MTIEELVSELMEYPLGTEVKVTWEGIVKDIAPDNIYLAQDGTVLIDADDNLYKNDFESGTRPAKT